MSASVPPAHRELAAWLLSMAELASQEALDYVQSAIVALENGSRDDVAGYLEAAGAARDVARRLGEDARSALALWTEPPPALAAGAEPDADWREAAKGVAR